MLIGMLVVKTHVSEFYRGKESVTEEDSISETAVWPFFILISTVTALKGTHSFNFYLLLLQLVLCRVEALKSHLIHHPYCRLYFPVGPLRSGRVFGETRNN